MLGHRSNVAHAWERGHRFPSATDAQRVAARVGIEPGAAWQRFYGGQAPAWLAEIDATTTEGLGRILADLNAGRSLSGLCRRAGISRHAAVRWVRGEASPRLPDLLRYLDAATSRLLDWLSCWVDPLQLPSAAARWQRMEAARQALFENPWAQIVLLAVDLAPFQALDEQTPQWLAERLRLPLPDVQRCLSLMVASGQLSLQAGRYTLASAAPLDAPAARFGTQLKALCAHIGLERMRAGDAGLFSYAVFSVSQQDYGEVRAILAEAYQRMRSVAERSAPNERLVVTNLQVFPLG
jgi:transcriptional regulator with XRE-family HTH domain